MKFLGLDLNCERGFCDPVRHDFAGRLDESRPAGVRATDAASSTDPYQRREGRVFLKRTRREIQSIAPTRRADCIHAASDPRRAAVSLRAPDIGVTSAARIGETKTHGLRRCRGQVPRQSRGNRGGCRGREEGLAWRRPMAHASEVSDTEARTMAHYILSLKR